MFSSINLTFYLWFNWRVQSGIRNSEGLLSPGWDIHFKIFRLPQKFCSNSRCFCTNLPSRYFRISYQMKEFFLSHTPCRKFFLVTERNIFALQVVINVHRKKFLVTERNLLSRAEISCQRKKCFCHRNTSLVTGRNFLS